MSLWRKLFPKPTPPSRPQKKTHYDLQAIYKAVNAEYFGGKLSLKISWFANASKPAYRYRKLGLYCFETKEIKIHRLLDHPDFPPYFISYVVYHEMLHSVCPPIRVKKRGRNQIHHSEFKKREREFADYALVKRWEEKNKQRFFYGRT